MLRHTVMVFISIYLQRLSTAAIIERGSYGNLLRIARGTAGGDAKIDHTVEHNVLC